MKLTPEIKKYIDQSVLCWLATVSEDGQPNVSPKEVFTDFGGVIIIANIASPNTVKNIQANPKVCISFIDILIQKGYQIKGHAEIVKKSNPDFQTLEKPLAEITKGKFPMSSITKVTIDSAKAIIAPSYLLFPETTEESQIESAKNSYRL